MLCPMFLYSSFILIFIYYSCLLLPCCCIALLVIRTGESLTTIETQKCEYKWSNPD